MTVSEDLLLLSVLIMALCQCSSDLTDYDNNSFESGSQVQIGKMRTDFNTSEIREINHITRSSDVQEFTHNFLLDTFMDPSSTDDKLYNSDLIKTDTDVQESQIEISKWAIFAGCGYWSLNKYQAKTKVKITFQKYFQNDFKTTTNKFDCLMCCSSDKRYKYFLYYKSFCKCSSSKSDLVVERNNTSCTTHCDSSYDVYCNNDTGALVFELLDNSTDSSKEEFVKAVSIETLKTIYESQCLKKQDGNFTIIRRSCKTILRNNRLNRKEDVIFPLKPYRFVQWSSHIDTIGDNKNKIPQFRTMILKSSEVGVSEHIPEHGHNNEARENTTGYSTDDETITGVFDKGDGKNNKRLGNCENDCISTYLIVYNVVMVTCTVMVMVVHCGVQSRKTETSETQQLQDDINRQSIDNNVSSRISSSIVQINNEIYSEIHINE